jgi:predicted Zn-dependent protease with MMP-like domain
MWEDFKDLTIIPKEFTISNTVYKVNVLDSTKDLDYNLGDYCSILHEIRLAKHATIDDTKIKISDNDILTTYLHELGHCFGDYYKDDHSEELACAFSHFMFDYIKSKK